MESDRITHTAWGQFIQAQLLMSNPNTPIILQPNTTLNEKLNIMETSRLDINDKVNVQWYCIGHGGHQILKSSNGIDYPDSVKRDPLEASLYDMVPFVLRQKNQDLTEEEARQYRLKRIETHGGVEYYAYYLKRMTIEDKPKVLIETTVDGVKQVKPYTVTEANLSPHKPTLSPREVVSASNTKVRVSIGASINFTEQDTENLKEVFKILYGTSKITLISEIGIVAGSDVANVSVAGGRTGNELKGATVVSILSVYHALHFSNNGFEERLELGEKTPLATTSPIVTTVGVPS